MTRLDEATLHALVDGQLSADEAARVESALQDLPEQLALVQAWRAQRAGLQRLAEAAETVDAATVAATLARMQDEPGDTHSEPVSQPEDAEGGSFARVRSQVSHSTLEQRRERTGERNGERTSDQTSDEVGERVGERPGARPPVWQRWALAAAITVVAWGAGWYGRGLVYSREEMSRAQEHTPLAARVPGFVREASSAYAVFTPEVRHPVEVTANEQAHLVQWLSRRLGRPLRLPDLGEQGYQLLGGRLLPSADGMGAMFMYQTSTGERLSLYMTVLAPTDPQGDTAFRFSDGENGTAPTFYWVDRDFGYAVSAKLPRDRIMAIARTVYAQTVEASSSR